VIYYSKSGELVGLISQTMVGLYSVKSESFGFINVLLSIDYDTRNFLEKALINKLITIYVQIVIRNLSSR